jgi:WD40 repeat protein
MLASHLFPALAPALISASTSVFVFSFGFISSTPLWVLVPLWIIHMMYGAAVTIHTHWKTELQKAYQYFDCQGGAAKEPHPPSPADIEIALQKEQKTHQSLLKEIIRLQADKKAWTMLKAEFAKAHTRFKTEIRRALARLGQSDTEVMSRKILTQLQAAHTAADIDAIEQAWTEQIEEKKNNLPVITEQKPPQWQQKAWGLLINCIDLLSYLLSAIGLGSVTWIVIQNQLKNLLVIAHLPFPPLPLIVGLGMVLAGVGVMIKWQATGKAQWKWNRDALWRQIKNLSARLFISPWKAYDQKCKAYKAYQKSNKTLHDIKAQLQIFASHLESLSQAYVLREYQQSKGQDEQLQWYIQPEAKASASEATRELKQVVEAFLQPATEAKILLLKGASAAGKSLFLRNLKADLFPKRNDPTMPRVIEIELKRFTPETLHTCLEVALREHGYEPQALAYRGRPLLFLLDGYDEIAGPYKGNLYDALGLHPWPHIKVIVTCRSEYLSPGDEGCFMPKKENAPWPEGLEQWELLPFSPAKIEAYLRGRMDGLAIGEALITAYEAAKQRAQNLEELVSNPFVLRMVAELLAADALNTLIKPNGVIDRATLYKAYIKATFEQQHHKNPAALPQDAFEKFIAFAQDFAFELHVKDRTEDRKDTSEFTSDFPDNMRWEGCPLWRRETDGGERHDSFVHKSFLEYFAACFIVEQVLAGKTKTVYPSHIVKSSAVVGFLTEMVTDEIQAVLFEQIEKTKLDKSDACAAVAANAISVLNTIGVNFSHRDFSGIAVPGAELGQALCYGTSFRDADLRKVKFQSAILTEADLTHAQMAEVTFGEHPEIVLPEAKMIRSLLYSPDGRVLVAGAWTGSSNELYIYDSHTGQLQKRLQQDHFGEPLAFHPRKPWLACAFNNNIQLCDIEQGKVIRPLYTYETGISWNCVFNTTGTTLAMRNNAGEVLLKDIATNDSPQLLTCFQFNILTVEMRMRTARSITYDPEDKFLAVSHGEEILIWMLPIDDQLPCKLKKEKSNFLSIALIPNQRLIADDSDNQNVQLWDIAQKVQIATITIGVSPERVVFDQKGLFFACIVVNEILLWNIADRCCQRVVRPTVGDIAFHPKDELLSIGTDHKIQSFDIINKAPGLSRSFSKNTSGLATLFFTPDNERLVAYTDNEILVLSTDNGTSIQFFFREKIRNVFYLSTSKQICSLVCEAGQFKLQDKDGKKLLDYEIPVNFRENRCILRRIHVDPTGQFIVADVILSTFGSDGGFQNFLILWNTEKEQCINTFQLKDFFQNPVKGFYNGEEWFDTTTHEDYDAFFKMCEIKKLTYFAVNGHLLGFTDFNSAYVYDITSKMPMVSVEETTQCFGCVALDTESQFFAFTEDHITVRLWSLERRTAVAHLIGHTDMITTLAFNTHHFRLASGSLDNTVRLWDLETNQCIGVLSSSAPIQAIAWSPDPQRLLLAIVDNMRGIYLWEIEQIRHTGRCAVVKLKWYHGPYALTLNGAHIAGVTGLDPAQHTLFMQHGAHHTAKETSITCIQKPLLLSSVNVTAPLEEQINPQAIQEASDLPVYRLRLF